MNTEQTCAGLQSFIWHKQPDPIPKYILVKDLSPKDKIIYTNTGRLKRRKNGKMIIMINGELMRVSPLNDFNLYL